MGVAGPRWLEIVAAAIVRAIEQERDESSLGWPEKLFGRPNAPPLPRLVDGARCRQHGVMRGFAGQTQPSPQPGHVANRLAAAL